MGNDMDINPEIAGKVIERMWLRVWLLALFFMTLGFGYLILGDPQVRNVAFFIYVLFAFCLIGVAILYKERYKRGLFGQTPDDRRLISDWFEETNHWWGKPLFSTHFTQEQ
jgi:hypothetical protein